ncbi:MAG: heme biosynthesis HemY N-terminal domain-containing protein [Gammaproteobacteria bacterium]|nr:heme biosynthesis HemY N-terminal domain-containing protein [Gammaproteobacteria bacterium]
MRLFFIILLLLSLVIAAGGLFIMGEAGSAVISHGAWSLEIELVYFYFASIALFSVLHVMLRIITTLTQLPARLQARIKTKRLFEILQSLENAQLAAEQKQWKSALRIVTKHSATSPVQRLQHVLAWHYAQLAGNTQAAEKHLDLLRNTDNGRSIANALEAQLVVQQQPAKALNLLEDSNPDSPNILITKAQGFMQNHDSVALQSLLLKLQQQAKNHDQVEHCLIASLTWLLADFVRNNDKEKLATLWKKYSSAIRSNQSLFQIYCNSLIDVGNDLQAEQIISQMLDTQWNDGLFHSYARLNLDNHRQRIQQLEQWLRQHPHNEFLLQLIGHLQLAQGDAKTAIQTLKNSLEIKPSIASYADLVTAHDLLEQPVQSREYAKLGLRLANQELH